MTIPFQLGLDPFSPQVPMATWPTPVPITYPVPELINGIHVDVTGVELKTLLEGRLAHHRERLAFYDAQLKTMAGMDVDGAMGRQTSGSMSLSISTPRGICSLAPGRFSVATGNQPLVFGLFVTQYQAPLTSFFG